MDSRLVATVAYVAHLVAGLLLAAATNLSDVTIVDGQLQFLVVVGCLLPLLGLALIWAGNDVLGAPLFAVTTGSTAGYAGYAFFLREQAAAVSTVGGDGATAYAGATVCVLVASLMATVVGLQRWYRASPPFRSLVDGLASYPDRD